LASLTSEVVTNYKSGKQLKQLTMNETNLEQQLVMENHYSQSCICSYVFHYRKGPCDQCFKGVLRDQNGLSKFSTCL